MGKKVKQETDISQQEPVQNTSDNTLYDSERLVRSHRMSEFGLHKDILRAILTEKSYTLAEAVNAVEAYLKSDAFKVEK